MANFMLIIIPIEEGSKMYLKRVTSHFTRLPIKKIHFFNLDSTIVNTEKLYKSFQNPGISHLLLKIYNYVVIRDCESSCIVVQFCIYRTRNKQCFSSGKDTHLLLHT